MKFIITFVVAVLGFVLSSPVFAADMENMDMGSMNMGNMNMGSMTEKKTVATETATGATNDASLEAVEVGNKICPVSGEKIVMGKEAKFEYNGKIYNLCCPMCEKDFKKDPEKYIKKVDEEMKAMTK